MSDRDTDKTIRIPQAKRTWTVEEHDDGNITVCRELRGHGGRALATSVPAGRSSWLREIVATFDRILGP